MNILNILDILLTSSLFLIMIGIGFSIKLKEILQELKHPKKLIIGTILQIIAFPLITFLLVEALDLNVFWKVGFMILAFCPSGALSNLLTSKLKGKLALSVQMTALTSLISLVILPILIKTTIIYYLGEEVMIGFPFLEFLILILTITTIPAIIGIFIKEKRPNWANKSQKTISNIGIILFIAILIVKFFFQDSGNTIPINHLYALLPVVILLNVLVVFAGYFLPRIIRTPKEYAKTFSLEMGIQNTTLGLLITETILGVPIFAKPILIYAMISLPTTFLLGLLIKKYFK